MSLLDPKVHTRDQNFRLTESWKLTTSDVTSNMALHLFPKTQHSLYTRDQNFRLTESWKLTTSDVTSNMALHLFPKIRHSLQALLRTVVMRTTEVDSRVEEQSDLSDDYVTTVQQLLHTHCMDAMWVSDVQAERYGLAQGICLDHRVDGLYNIFKIKCDDDTWGLECDYAECLIAKSNMFILGKPGDLARTRLWHTRPPNPSSPYFDCTIPLSLVVEVDVGHADAMRQMGTAVTMVRDSVYLPLQTRKSTSTYLILPAKSRSIEKKLVPNTDHLQRYSSVWLLLQENSNNSQWCAAHCDKVLMTLRLETFLGSARRQVTKLLSTWKFRG